MSNILCFAKKGKGGKMNVKAYLNPNPPLRGETLVDPGGRKYETKNDPFLEVELWNFPKGEYDIELVSPFILKKKVEVNLCRFSLYFVDPRFENPAIHKVKIKVKGKEITKEFTLPIYIHKLQGRVRDFNGNPKSAYIWATLEGLVENEIIGKSDEDGNFTLYYSEGRRLRVFVDDATYGRTTLETWIMGNELKSDVEINPHIGGNLELYEFKAWYFDDMWDIFFLPAVVDAPLPPPLKKENLRVWINGLEGKIKSFTPHKVYFGGVEKGKCPAYIMNVVVDKGYNTICPPAIIRALIDLPEKGKGEGWYIHY